MRRNVFIDDLGLDRLQDAHLLGLPQVPGVYGEQQVSRGVLAFSLDALHERRFLVGNELDLDPGFRGVGVKYRLDQLVDARGINHHFIGSKNAAPEHGKGQGSQ